MARKRGKQDGRPALVKRDGALALTFVNTGSRRSRRLRDYADLLAWSVEHGALTAADADRLERLAAEHPQDAEAGFAAAEELHALLSRIFNGRVDGTAPAAETIRELDALLERSVPRRMLTLGRARPEWRLAEDPDRDLFRPLWPVADSATRILTSGDYDKVRRCAGEGCDLLFLAKGRGMPRRWCSDKSCGVPLRSRRHYLRVVKPARKAEDARLAARSRRISSEVDGV
ncbi:MAG TPA: ABATE domain-containing protein [Thermoanaerobaculia bacterium]|jgi:predicted RNA-binding Zn ribbon-like protein